MTLGERIRLLRRREYTQEQFAEVIGVHINTVNRWEGGTRVPNAEALQKIAKALGVSVAYLVEGEELRREGENIPTQGGIPTLSYWADVVDKARAAVKRGQADELIDIRQMLEKALTAVENGCLTLGIAQAKTLPAGDKKRPSSEHGKAV